MTSEIQNSPTQWAHKAFEQMLQDSIDPTPDNFSVYYTYFSGADPNLKMAMDALLEQYGRLNQTQCTELYLAHIGLEAENHMLQVTTTNIEEEIKKVMGVITRSVEDASHYHEELTDFKGAVEGAPSMDRIREAVARVANETHVMAQQNQRLQAQLAHSTQELTEMRYSLDQVRKASLIDPLTEIGNRKFFDTELIRVIEEAKETQAPLSLLMADIDHFKKFNDTYGHLIGDEVLKLVARTLVENLKGRDIIARYGGEEFVIVLPQTTVEDAEKVANQLRSILSTKQVRRRRTNETLGIVTISLGATQYVADEDSDSFIARADAALYDAKQTGRNKVMTK